MQTANNAGFLKKIMSLDTWRWQWVRAEGEAWERYFCARTARSSALEPTMLPPENVRYEPLPWQLVRQAIDLLELKPDDTFVDYGAGLGRALLMAARLKVKRVLGIEWLASLANAGQKNVAAAQEHHRLRSPVSMIVGDAAAWEVPDDVTAAYFFNPFNGSVMANVQERLRASLKRNPRPFRLLYARTLDRPDLFASCEWLELRRSVGSGVFKELHFSLYGDHAEMC